MCVCMCILSLPGSHDLITNKTKCIVCDAYWVYELCAKSKTVLFSQRCLLFPQSHSPWLFSWKLVWVCFISSSLSVSWFRLMFPLMYPLQRPQWGVESTQPRSTWRNRSWLQWKICIVFSSKRRWGSQSVVNVWLSTWHRGCNMAGFFKESHLCVFPLFSL